MLQSWKASKVTIFLPRSDMTNMRGTAATMQIDPKEAVLQTLRKEKALFPEDLMERLQKNQKLNDAATKDAIWALMRDGFIEFTSDHKLTCVENAGSRK